MNLMDILSIIFLVVWLVLGYKRGFFFELLSVVVMAVSFFAAYFLHPMLTDVVSKFFTVSAGLNRAVFLILFLVLNLTLNLLVGKIVQTLSSGEKAHPFMRLLGSLVALIRGGIYIGSLLIIILPFISKENVVKQIEEGVVTKHLIQGVTVSYDQIDKLIRKNNIDPAELVE